MYGDHEGENTAAFIMVALPDFLKIKAPLSKRHVVDCPVVTQWHVTKARQSGDHGPPVMEKVNKEIVG